MRLVIADTSCFILFKKIGQLFILKNSFSEIIATDKVAAEFGSLPSWVKIRDDYDNDHFKALSINFGPGESSSIALAAAQQSPLLLIDDRRAKKVAEEIGIECVGSLGVLLIAKRKGVIESVSESLDRIEKTDFRITNRLVTTVLKLAGEY